MRYYAAITRDVTTSLGGTVFSLRNGLKYCTRTTGETLTAVVAHVPKAYSRNMLTVRSSGVVVHRPVQSRPIQEESFLAVQRKSDAYLCKSDAGDL